MGIFWVSLTKVVRNWYFENSPGLTDKWSKIPLLTKGIEFLPQALNL